jgi:FKBP-type peptidyl-prolyl cis-trans isomerase SlyD
MDIKPGMGFHARGPDGSTVMVWVTGVTPQTVTVDMNHPLAGKTLNFDVQILAVRAATSEELAHGHPHGPDGHGGHDHSHDHDDHDGHHGHSHDHDHE